MDDDASWAERAACRGTNPDSFFVRGAAQARPAQQLCGGCGVREACLDYALTNDIDFGVWGGLTERQRRSLQRRQYAATG